MTDEEYVLISTNRDRSSLNASARKRKVGSKSKSCKLGSDYMSNKQMQLKNGPVKTFAMNMPCSLNMFNEQDEDIKRDYLEGLFSKYGFRQGDLMKMLNIRHKEVCILMDTYGIRKFASNAHKTKEEAELFKAFFDRANLCENSASPQKEVPDWLTDIKNNIVPKSVGNMKASADTKPSENNNSSTDSGDPFMLVMQMHEFTKTSDSIKMSFDKSDRFSAIALISAMLEKFPEDSYIEISANLREK